jgi:hypothetical protein
LVGTPEPFYVVFNDSTIKSIRLKKRMAEEPEQGTGLLSSQDAQFNMSENA